MLLPFEIAHLPPPMATPMILSVAPQPIPIIPAAAMPFAFSPAAVTPATAIAIPVTESEIKSNPLSIDIGAEDKGRRKTKKKRQRSAFLSELRFKGYLDPNSNGPNSRIRIWVNAKDMHYYDCSCGKRKAVQDLYKIKQHTKRHEVSEYTCRICAKTFQHHLQINAHMKVHKRGVDDRDAVMSEDVQHHHISGSTSSSSTGITNSKPAPSEFENNSTLATSTTPGISASSSSQQHQQQLPQLQEDACSVEQVDCSRCSSPSS
jgi:hypothetical protein